MKYIYSHKDFELAKKFVDAVLSMDKIYRQTIDDTETSFSSEGLVPVILTDLKYNEIGNWEDIKKLLLSLYNEYKIIDNDVRKNYMFEQISSVITMGEWVFENKKFGYRQLVSGLLFVNNNPVTKRQIDINKKDIDNFLSDKNYKGTFEEKIKGWKNDNLVKPQYLQSVLDSLTAQAKEKTLNLGFSEIENVDVKCIVEHDVPYSGYCDFLENTIYINGDMEYTYPGLKHLICHETHPGHMTHMQVRKTLVEKGEVPVDAALVITNTASSVIFEGLADNGINFLGWLENKDDLIARLYQNLNSKLSISIAHMMHEENIDVEKVKRYYKDTLTATDVAVDSKIRFLTYPFRKPFVYCYWRGNESIESIYNRISKNETAEFLRFVYNHMQSINTANQFI